MNIDPYEENKSITTPIKIFFMNNDPIWFFLMNNDQDEKMEITTPMKKKNMNTDLSEEEKNMNNERGRPIFG